MVHPLYFSKKLDQGWREEADHRAPCVMIKGSLCSESSKEIKRMNPFTVEGEATNSY